MSPKAFGKTLTALRKKRGMTQSALAEKLHVTDKAVSKWETGLGFPEIALFPEIAAVFGVTVDYLMTGQRRGITIAGNILADVVKDIDCYPEKGLLANITRTSRAVGGCVPNTAIDLAKIDPSLLLSAIGCVGDDEYGQYVVSKLRQYNVNTDKIRITDKAPTSFSDVMSMPSGERTFFHARGANALFSPEDIDIPALQCVLFHIGYILLLDQFDQPDDEYGTVMARFLSKVQQAGIKISVDVVSDSSGDYPRMLIPVLPYCDYIIFNEIECCNTWGISPRNPDGTLNEAAVREAMERTLAGGVREKVIVHSKEIGYCLNSDGHFSAVPALNFPKSEIKGSVGAGDAFCAGCLYGIYEGWSDEEILLFAAGSAVCNLMAPDSISGMKTKAEIRQIIDQYSW